MKLRLEQRLFSWFDSYDDYNEDGSVAYVVKGRPDWGHCLKIFDPDGNELGMVRERVWNVGWWPTFDLHIDGRMIGSIRNKTMFWRPSWVFDFNGWSVQGELVPTWDENYTIFDSDGNVVAGVSKVWWEWKWTDTYAVDIVSPGDALLALMFALALDAYNCTCKDD